MEEKEAKQLSKAVTIRNKSAKTKNSPSKAQQILDSNIKKKGTCCLGQNLSEEKMPKSL